MRNFSNPASMSRKTSGMQYRGQGAHSLTPLAGANQARYKGLTPAPGYVKFSMWKKETDIPRYQFVDYLLQKIKEKDPSSVWLKDVTNGRVETFGRVPGTVAKMASGLTKLGFGRRDVMCLYCSNYVEYWLLALAAWTCGGCVMPVNCEVDLDVLEDQLAEAKPKILVCDDFNVEDAVDIYKNTDLIPNLVVIGMEGKDQGCTLVSDLINDDGKTPPSKYNPVWDRDPIYLPFSSSHSKEGSRGILHTNKSILSWFYQPEHSFNHYLDQMVGDKIACGNWFFHLSGFYLTMLSAIYGISVYFLSEYTDTNFVEMIVDNRIQTAALYPWQIRFLSQSPKLLKFDLSCLKAIVTSGGVLSSTIKSELLERYPHIKHIREAYGLNECGLVTLTYPREKKTSVMASKVLEVPDDHIMPIGLPNMYTHIKIRSRQTNEPVGGPDEQGEICVRSPQNFTGYLNYRNNAKLFDHEEYFPTGDVGYYDSQGTIFFVERIDSMIHFWMYEVSPSIIEARLLGSNNIVDAAVVGIPDKENGEVPRAFVVLRPGFEETEENLIGLMESRLQDHERIRGGLYFVESIPRDENWKVLKDILQDYKPQLAYENADIQSGTSLSASVTPKAGKKFQVKELEKQANGRFVAQLNSQTPESPGMRRAKKTSVSSSTVENNQPKDKLDSMASPEKSLSPGKVGGMRRRSGEQSGSRSHEARAARRGSTDGKSGPALVGSCGPAGSGKGGEGTFNYWMKVHVQPKVLEHVLNGHPAVADSWVTGYHVAGVGSLPRAYIVFKQGHTATPDEMLTFAHSRLADTDRLRGGIVFVEKLPKDPDGRVIMNLQKYEGSAYGVDMDFIHGQPKVKT